MARILTAGNEFGDIEADDFYISHGPVTTSRTQASGATSPKGNRGSYCFYASNNTGVAHDFSAAHPAGIGEFFFRTHMYFGGRNDGTWENIRFTAADGTVLLRYSTTGSSNPSVSGGTFYNGMYNNAGTQFVNNGGLTHKNNDWHLVEFHVKFGGSGAYVAMWMNNRFQFDWSGSLVGNSGEDKMYILDLNYQIISGGTASSRYYDNVAINDLTGTINNGRAGDGYVLPFWPEGVGASSQLFNPMSTSVDNFKFINVRKTSQLTGRFVAPSAAGQKDTYTIRKVPEEFHGVNAIKIHANALRYGTAITKAKLLVQPPAQIEIAEPAAGIIIPQGSDTFISQEFGNNPNNSNQPFTIDEVNGMETGIQFIA
jgi:hypothetical protein